MRRHSGPIQQWIDSIPSPTKADIAIANDCQELIMSRPLTPTKPKDIPLPKERELPSMIISPTSVPNSPVINVFPSSLPSKLVRDPSFQSDSSHCSSVDSLLELRKADPAAILLDLGFGGCSTSPQQNGPLSRIPSRFLQPSSLKGIAVNDFVKQQQQTSESLDTISLGYRGLTGSPHITPSEIVQKIMERLREHENHETDANPIHNYHETYNPSYQNGKLSVLSPDNRQFLERPRSKSPDMRNKRMIIGQKSFAFGYDGSLIEISSNDAKAVHDDVLNNHNTMADSRESIELKQSTPIENITLEQHPLKSGKKLCKQLSFDDDTIEFPEVDQLIDERKTPLNNLNVAQRSKDIGNKKRGCNLSNINPKYENHGFLQRCFDTRRASDSSCDVKALNEKVFDEGRRFSDGAMHIIEDQSTELLRKRRNFKRQSKVCDTNTIHYLNSTEANTLGSVFQSNADDEGEQMYMVNSTDITKLSKSPQNTNYIELKTDMESSYTSSSTISGSVDKIEPSESMEEALAASNNPCKEDNQVRYYEDKICKNCKHGSNCPDCCCHIDKRKCWKKMEKIMKENKKLEDMLAKSRREVAEIRDMLSSVLSVRMEPGF